MRQPLMFWESISVYGYALSVIKRIYFAAQTF